MKKIILFSLLGAIIILAGVILIVGRGEEPKQPYRPTDSSKSDPFSLISRDGLVEDIDYYLSLIDQAHGDPYHQVTKPALWAKAEEVKIRLRAFEPEEIQLIDAYFYLQEVAAFMQDEHTKVWFIRSWHKHFPERFPLGIKIYDGNVYVIQDLSPTGIPVYAKLLSINGKPVGEMIDECWKFVNQTLPHYKRQIAEQTFGTWLQAYFKNKPPWEVAYRYNGQETGGRQVFSSDSITIEMPKSTLNVFVPVAILALAGDNPDRGILPDVEVEYTFEDYKSKKDKDLEKVKELILQDQQRK